MKITSLVMAILIGLAVPFQTLASEKVPDKAYEEARNPENLQKAQTLLDLSRSIDELTKKFKAVKKALKKERERAAKLTANLKIEQTRNQRLRRQFQNQGRRITKLVNRQRAHEERPSDKAHAPRPRRSR